MDKYFIANIVVWLVIITLCAVLWKHRRPSRFGIRHIFIALGVICFWGLITGYPPYILHGIPLNRGGLFAYFLKLVIWVPILRFIHRKKWIYVTPFRIALAVGVLFCIGLIGTWPGYYFPGYSGRVVDMDTGKPIKDAVVKVEIVYAGGFSPGGPVSEGLRTLYLVTGEDGRYSVGPSMDILVLGWARYVEISAMHILTAETRKEIDPPQTWPVYEDIQLMSAKKYFEASHAKRGIPAGVGFSGGYDPERMVKAMLWYGVPSETIQTYYRDLLKARKSVYGEDDPYAKDWQPKEEWFR